MPLALLALIQGIISAVPVAQQLWEALLPILRAARDPTPEEWAELNALADDAHSAVQAEAKPKRGRASRRVVHVSRPDRGGPA